MKLTRFTVFIILLIVLIISLFFSNWVPIEPFISYNYVANTNISSNQVSVPPYSTSKSIYKVYDSIYFDPQNGNVIELFGTPYTNSVDTTGDSLTNMVLMPRVGSLVVEYDSTDTKGSFSNVAESKYLNSQMESTYTSWYYPNTQNTSSKLTGSIEYQVFCFPWKTDTVLFINDIIKKKTVGIFSYIGSNSPNGLVKSTNYNMNYSINNTSDYNFNMANGSSIPGYNGSVSPDVYKVFSNIWYDTKKGTIIYKDNNQNANSINVDTSLQFSSSNRNYAIVNTSDNIILGIPFSSNRSMVVVLGADKLNSSYLTILNVIRFDPSMPDGIDRSMADNGIHNQQNQPQTQPVTCNNVQVPSTPQPAVFNPSDYIAKTQIVPPVCPACPAIPQSSTNDTIAQVIKNMPVADTLTNIVKVLKNEGIINPATQPPSQQQHVGQSPKPSGEATTNPGWGLANNILNNTGNILTNAENVVGNTAGGIVGGATQIGTGAVGGATQIGTGAISGATQLGIGAENVVGSVASNVSNVVSNAITGATALGVGAENVIGNVATNLIGGATSLGVGAENIIGRTIDKAGNIVEKTVDKAGNIVEKTIDTTGNVISTTVTSAQNVVGGATNMIGNVATGAENVVGGTINTAANLSGNVITGAEQAIGNIGSIAPINLNATQQPQIMAPRQPQPQYIEPTIYPINEFGGIAGNVAGGAVTTTCKDTKSQPKEEEYEYVYEEIEPDDEYYNKRYRGQYNQAPPPAQPAPVIATPAPQIIYIQPPTPSVALMPTMPPMPTEEIYECEDEEEEEETKPSRKNKKTKKQTNEDSKADQDMYNYYYNVPAPGAGQNGYFGSLSNKDNTTDFVPMSSDFSKFGR